MSRDEIENCTFEPEAGTMSQSLHHTLRVHPNLNREEFTNEPDPEAYFTKLGTNFEKSHPEVFKAGIIRRAK